MKITVFFNSAILLSLLLAFSCGNQAGNQDKLENPQQKTQEQPGNSDAIELQEFINEAISEGMMEVDMADIAMSRTVNTEIVQLAETIRLNHRSAANELKSLAASKGWSLQTTMLDKHQQQVNRLRNTEAENFDEEYLEIMVDMHKDGIEKFEKCAAKGYDEQFVIWVNRTLSVMRQHLEYCEELTGRVAAES